MSKLLDGIIKASIYLIVFLLPLFFLPFSVEWYEFNKLYLLFALLLVSLVGHLGKLIFVERSLVFVRTPLDSAVFFLLAGVILAAIFSNDHIASLLGFYGRFFGGLAELLLWALFYLMITHNFSYQEARKLFVVLFVSAWLLSLLFHLSWLGMLQTLPSLVQFGLTPVGAFPQTLAVFISLSLLFLLLYWSVSPRRGVTQTLLSTIASLSYLSVLVIINFTPAWLVLFLSCLLFFSWVLYEKMLPGAEINRLSFVVFTLLVSFVFLVFPRLFSFDVPREQTLLHRASWQVAYTSLTSPPFLGSGTGNFFGAYTLFRPLVFNQAPEWSLRFHTASSHYANVVSEMGIAGILGFLGFVIVTFYLMSKLFSHSLEFKREGALYLFGFAGLLLSMAFYYQSVSLSLLLWLFLACFSILLGMLKGTKKYQRDFGLTPEANLFLTSLFLVGIFTIGLLGYFGGRFYYADAAYQRGLSIPHIDQKINHFQEAVAFNPFRIEYRIALAHASLAKLTGEVQSQGAENIQDLTPLQALADQAVLQINRSVELAPNSVISWENRGIVFRELRAFEGSGYSSDVAIESFTRAGELEPANPAFPTQVAFLHIQADQLDEAQIFIDKARGLKADYPTITLAQALLREKQGKLPEAIEALEAMVIRNDLPPFLLEETLLHLGRIAYNNNQPQKAIAVLEELVDLNPNNSNAHYALALAYERVGNRSKARQLYERVLELNPGNTQVKEQLQQLE